MISLLLTLILGFASDLCNNKDIILILGYNYNILIKGIINVLNFSRRGKGMVFRTWGHGQIPLNSQWPVLKNGGVDFHHCLFVDSIYKKNVLGNF